VNKLRIALAKGRLADKSVEIFEGAGVNLKTYKDKSRRLVFNDEYNDYQFVLVKSSDVPVYVERGTVDLGIVGKDVLMENNFDVYEVLNLNIGRCKLCIAGLQDFDIKKNKRLTIATKYPNIARNYFTKRGLNIELITLRGSVELAPLLGLSNIILDIVETGRTLKENGLTILEDLYDISAKLIVNKASLKTKRDDIEELIDKIEEITKGES